MATWKVMKNRNVKAKFPSRGKTNTVHWEDLENNLLLQEHHGCDSGDLFPKAEHWSQRALSSWFPVPLVFQRASQPPSWWWSGGGETTSKGPSWCPVSPLMGAGGESMAPVRQAFRENGFSRLEHSWKGVGAGKQVCQGYSSSWEDIGAYEHMPWKAGLRLLT